MSDRAARLVKWLGRQPQPFGVMGATDAYAWLAAMAAPAAGLAVPADMAIVGVDNDDVFCSLARPPITSVVTNNVGLGFEAAALLDRLLAVGTRSVPRQEIMISPLGITPAEYRRTARRHAPAAFERLDGPHAAPPRDGFVDSIET
jgi:DNA-binding LacI/PurR family transcriptional regulator